MSGLLLRYSPFILGAALSSVLLHILILLVLPLVAPRTSGQLLADRAVLGDRAGQSALSVLAVSRPGAQAYPFADPAMVTALCAFDLTEGPFRIRTSTGEAFLSLAVLSPAGRVLHALSDKAATRRMLDVVLVTEQQQRALEAQDPEDEAVQELRLRMTAPKGTVLLRTFAPRPSDIAAARELLGRAECRTLQDG
jgi:uncharacterized membrane protein